MLQSLGCSSEEVLNLAQWLVQDYCVLVPQAMPVLHTLPSLSPHFTCNLITTLTMLYKPKGMDSSLLQNIEMIKHH